MARIASLPPRRYGMHTSLLLPLEGEVGSARASAKRSSRALPGGGWPQAPRHGILLLMHVADNPADRLRSAPEGSVAKRPNGLSPHLPEAFSLGHPPPQGQGNRR